LEDVVGALTLELPWRTRFRPRDLARARFTEQGDELDNFTTANKKVRSAIIAVGTSLVRAGNVCPTDLFGCYHFNALIKTFNSAPPYAAIEHGTYVY
jgi:hypothetical protein